MNLSPFNDYINAWSHFREITNETQEIAKHLINNTSIKGKKSILDLGSGDGTLIKNIIKYHSFDQVFLIEAEFTLLENAKKNLKPLSAFIKCQFINKDFTSLDYDLIKKFDAILISHSLYSVDEDYLKIIFDHKLKDTTIYVVLDKPYSVFDSFWIHTSPQYHHRLDRMHKFIENLPNSLFSIKRTEIKSQMINPLSLPEDKKISVLSFLCYRQIKEDFIIPEHFAKELLEKFRFKDSILCNSYCYEITSNKISNS